MPSKIYKEVMPMVLYSNCVPPCKKESNKLWLEVKSMVEQVQSILFLATWWTNYISSCMFHDDEDEVEPPKLPYYDQHTDLDLSFLSSLLKLWTNQVWFFSDKKKTNTQKDWWIRKPCHSHHFAHDRWVKDECCTTTRKS